MGLGHFRRKRKGDVFDTGPLLIRIEGGLPAGEPTPVVHLLAYGRRAEVRGGLPEYAPSVWPLPTPERLADLDQMYARVGGQQQFDPNRPAVEDGLGNQKSEGLPLEKGQ